MANKGKETAKFLSPAYAYYVHSKKGKKAARKEAKRVEKHNKFVRKQEKYGFKNFQDYMKRYGEEKFFHVPHITKEQEKTLYKFAERGAEPRASRSEFDKFQRAFRQQEIPEARGLAPLEDIRQNPLFQSEQARVQDLLNPTGQAFRDFAQPELNNFRQQIVPEVAAQFGQGATGGSGSSAFNQALAGAQGNLQAKLASLRRGLQQQGGQRATELAQAPISNQLYYNPQRQAQNTQEFQRAYYGNQQRLGLGQFLNEQQFRQGAAALQTQPFQNLYRPPALGTPVNVGSYQTPPAPYQNPLNQFFSNAIPGAGQAAGQAAVAGLF